MANVVLHPVTEEAVQQFCSRPAHALLLTGSPGSGKASVAHSVAQAVLKLTPAAYETYAYRRELQPEKSGSISIESIRSLQNFLTLKVPGGATLARVIVIQNAHAMTAEAQNALLKTLEEPPADTVLILTSVSREALLPTIQSRSQTIMITPPPVAALRQHFTNLGFTTTDIDRALFISAELPGLTHALLSAEVSHPLYEATSRARQVLQGKPFDRLLLVDSLAKQKPLAHDVLFMLQQMAHLSLLKQPDIRVQQRWQRIMRLSYDANEQLEQNTQPKLVLINLMLAL